MSQNIAVEWVKHHRRVHALEHAGLQQLDLTAAALFGWGADDLDRAGQVRRLASQRQERADRAARDQVVTAGVADVGQRVVLG